MRAEVGKEKLYNRARHVWSWERARPRNSLLATLVAKVPSECGEVETGGDGPPASGHSTCGPRSSPGKRRNRHGAEGQ